MIVGIVTGIIAQPMSNEPRRLCHAPGQFLRHAQVEGWLFAIQRKPRYCHIPVLENPFSMLRRATQKPLPHMLNEFIRECECHIRYRVAIGRRLAIGHRSWPREERYPLEFEHHAILHSRTEGSHASTSSVVDYRSLIPLRGPSWTRTRRASDCMPAGENLLRLGLQHGDHAGCGHVGFIIGPFFGSQSSHQNHRKVWVSSRSVIPCTP